MAAGGLQSETLERRGRFWERKKHSKIRWHFFWKEGELLSGHFFFLLGLERRAVEWFWGGFRERGWGVGRKEKPRGKLEEKEETGDSSWIFKIFGRRGTRSPTDFFWRGAFPGMFLFYLHYPLAVHSPLLIAGYYLAVCVCGYQMATLCLLIWVWIVWVTCWTLLISRLFLYFVAVDSSTILVVWLGVCVTLFHIHCSNLERSFSLMLWI